MDKFDHDGSGTIDEDKLIQGLWDMGLTRPIARRFISLFDKDNDGCLNFTEFYYMLMHLIGSR